MKQPKEYLFCAKNPKSLKIKTKLSNVSDCLLIPTLCFEENLLRNQKSKSYQRIKSWPPTDEKAMPLQFNEKKGR